MDREAYLDQCDPSQWQKLELQLHRKYREELSTVRSEAAYAELELRHLKDCSRTKTRLLNDRANEAKHMVELKNQEISTLRQDMLKLQNEHQALQGQLVALQDRTETNGSGGGMLFVFSLSFSHGCTGTCRCMQLNILVYMIWLLYRVGWLLLGVSW